MNKALEEVARRLDAAKLPRHVTAGIVSNLAHESRGDPGAHGDSGTSIGLAQWRNERGQGLVDFAKARGKRNTDPGVQADYLLHELSQAPELVDQLAKTRSPNAAAMLFQRKFERPKVIDPERGSTARGVMSWLGGVLSPSAAQAAGPSRGAAAWEPPAEAFSGAGDAWAPPAEAFGTTASEGGTVPAGVRAAVGAAQTPEDRLATLKRFYPNAAITPTDDNFDIEDPKAGRLVYNPAGIDTGDVASLGSEAAQFAGGTIGAVLGAPAGLVGGVAGAGLGTAAGSELFNLFAKNMMGTADTRSAGRQVGDAATMAVTSAGGQAAGEMLGMIPRAISKAFFRGGKQGLAQFSQAVADADKWGVPVSVGEAGDNAWRVFDTMAPKSAVRLKERAAKAAGNSLKSLTQDVSGGRGLSYTNVGRTIEEGIKSYKGAVRTSGQGLDQEFFKHVPPDASIPMTNTLAAIQRVIPDMQSMPATAAAEKAAPLGQRMARLAQDISDGQGNLHLGDVRTFRRTVGEMIESGALVEDIPLIKLRDLHGALSNDLRTAADAAGPAAQQAWSKAQTFWQKELRLMEDVLTPLTTKRVPSEVSRALEGKMKNAPEYLDGVMKTLNPKQRDLVRAATLRKLGNVKPSGQGAGGDTWSFDQFLTDWNGLDRKSRNVLFKDREYASDLDALARTAERLHTTKAAGAVPNYAIAGALGTAAIAPVAAASGGWLMLPAGFALSAMGATGGQRLMRNRSFVHWLAKSTEASASGVGAHVGRLTAIARNSDQETRDNIGVFLEHLSGEE